MDLVSMLLDLAKMLFSLGLFAYAMTLYRTFSGGRMQGAFKFLLVAPLFFAMTEGLNLLKYLGIIFFDQKLLADAFELLFIIALFIGFYRLALVWRLKQAR